jgi:hypothetical protein
MLLSGVANRRVWMNPKKMERGVGSEDKKIIIGERNYVILITL